MYWSRKNGQIQSIYIYIFIIKVEDVVIFLPQSIYIYIFIIKVEDVAIFLPCGIYGNVFYLTLIILVGQITPHDRILLVMYLHVSIYLIIIGYFMTFLNHFWGHASIGVHLQNRNGLNITTTKSTNLPS
jgi:hypothetical protein